MINVEIETELSECQFNNQCNQGSKVQRYKGTKVQRYKGTKVQRYKGTKVQRYKGILGTKVLKDMRKNKIAAARNVGDIKTLNNLGSQLLKDNTKGPLND